MKKETIGNKVVKESVEVRSPDSSSEVWNFLEVNGLDDFSKSLKNQHLKELVVIMRGSNINLDMLMLLTIPILMHCWSDKNSIDKNFVSTKVINGGEEIRQKEVENYGRFFHDCLLQFKRSLSLKKNRNRKVRASYHLDSNKEKNISVSTKKNKNKICHDITTSLISSDIWNASRTRVFGRDSFKDETEKIRVVRGDRYLQDFFRFFKSYNRLVVSKNGGDCYQNNLDLLSLQEIRNKQDLGVQAIRLRNNLFNPVGLHPCEKVLLESIDSADQRGDGSTFSFEQEAFSNLSSFMSCKKTMLFRNFISGLDFEKDRKDFPSLYAYLQIRNQLINRLIDFIKTSSLIVDGEIGIDISNSIESEKGFLQENMPFTKISDKKLGLSSSGYFDFNEILPNYFKASFRIPKETTNGSKNLNKLKGRWSLVDSIYLLVRLYGQKKIIFLYSTYIFLFHDYFCALSTEYFFRINYWLDDWTGRGEYTSVTRIATEYIVFKWKDDVERLWNEYITSRIDEFLNVQLNVRKWITTTENLYLLPVGKFLEKAMKDDLKVICRMSIMKNKLLNNTDATKKHTNKCFHRFLNVVFFSKMIVAEITRQKALIDTIDYCIEKLNELDEKLNKLNLINKPNFSLPSDFVYEFQEDVLFLKEILERKRSLFLKPRLLRNEELIGSSTALKPALNPTFLELPHIEAIRTGFSSEALSITGGYIWRNLFLHDLNWEGVSIRNIGAGISKNIFYQMDKINHSPIQSRAVNNFIPRIERGFFIGKCNSNLLSFNSSEQVERVAGHLLTSIQFCLSNLHESATTVTHLDGLPISILDLNGLLKRLNSSPREAIDSVLAPINSDLDHQQPQSRWNLVVLGRVNSEKFFQKGLGSKNGFTGNRVYQDNLSIRYLWEPEKLDTPYWSLRFSLCNNVTSRFLSGSIVKEVSRGDAGFADESAQEEATRSSQFTNLNELSTELDRYKISWIFWKDNMDEKWSLLRDYIPLFFTPTWWRYFYDLIRETYPEIILKLSYDSNHELPRISKKIAEDLLDGAKSYLFRRLQRLGLKFEFENNSINNLFSKIGLLIPEKISDEAEMSYPEEWSVSQFSNRSSILYCCILSILFVFTLLKHPLSAVSGFNSFHLWKRFDIIEYLTDPMRGFYLKKNELDSWLFCRESSDIIDSNKELLTQCLVTTKIFYKYGSKSKSNYDLLSNKIVYQPYPQERCNILEYLLKFWQNNLLGHKIRKLDPAEKWAFSAFGRNILFSAAAPRRNDSLLNMPYSDIPISLQSRLLPSKGILLVGPIETGRSSIIRNVAFNSYFPVVKLSLKRFIYNRSFLGNVRGNFISKESAYRLNMVFEIAREMSPCTLWIQDIHELNINRSYNKLEADPKFLLCQILNRISHKLSNFNIRKNVVIATTHVPARIDPASFNGRQRQKELSILLRIKGFKLETNPSLIESNVSGTTGYSKRDLFFLANEALLIGTFKRKKFVCSNAIQLALHRQHSAVSDMGHEMESDSEWKISSYEIAEATSKNSLIDTYLTNISFIGRDALKMRFYYLSNWYVEPSRNESTIDEFTVFSHLLRILAELVAHDSFQIQMDMRKKENFIVIDKLVENDLNLACGVLENLSNNFSRSEIFRKGSQRNNSFSIPFPIGEPKYCLGVTSTSCSSKFLRKEDRLSSSLADFEMQQSPELIASTTEISREITWSHKTWRLRFLRSRTYELMGVLSEPNHLYKLILLYQNQNYIPQQNFEFNNIKGEKSKGRNKSGYLFNFEKSATNETDSFIKRLENQLDNMLLREQFLELGISGDSSINEYETHCDRINETTRLFGRRFIWDPMLLLYNIYGMRRQRLQKTSNKKIKNFFLYREDNPKLKPDSSINRWPNLSLDEEEQDSEYVKETSFIDIYLQYPQIFIPVHLDCYTVAEDFPERFLRFRLLVHRNRWMRRNRSPFQDFLIYNMLLETYEYLSNPFLFGETSLDQ
ncbi:hypothetical protein KP509_29G003000 [Ceratopteris richardii]|uniref:ATPase AAA-type core domain-containing protein n=1 Tax=Ceratopteris richardii TaxID=49495 RepID=A0A8T2R589_CERRI|nr:hypothetical protein KP509_29G003000 [Ceratopteris richardii]